jgi:hypothetical protein
MICASPSQENNSQSEFTSTMLVSHEKNPKELEYKTFKALYRKGRLVLVTCNFENLESTMCCIFAKEMVGNFDRFSTRSHSGYSYKDEISIIVFKDRGVKNTGQEDRVIHK